MLFVLSEIECLDFIRSVGVYPDEYYTDFELFKNKLALANDADIVILMAGTCRMSKRIITELATQLKNRADDKTDSGVRSVCLMTDTELNSPMDYYMYEDRPLFFKKYVNGRKQVGMFDVWEKYKGEEHETMSYLKKIDIEAKINAIRDRRDRDDALLEVIKVPDLH